jgi:hypothetical protein
VKSKRGLSFGIRLFSKNENSFGAVPAKIAFTHIIIGFGDDANGCNAGPRKQAVHSDAAGRNHVPDPRLALMPQGSREERRAGRGEEEN